MSTYQADWFVDEDGNWNGNTEEGEEEGEDIDVNEEDDRTMVGNISIGTTLQRARDDEDFPDEMDTPEDVAARQRFA
jgi:hypothetical protein